MKSFKELKEKVKGSKKVKILCGVTAGAAAIGVTVLVTRKWDYIHADKLLKPNEIMCGVSKPIDIPFDKKSFKAGNMIELWEEGDFVNVIIEDTNLDSLKESLMEIDDWFTNCERFDVIVSAAKSK